jgi:hypothetical protein
MTDTPLDLKDDPTPETVQALARLVGLPVPPEDLEDLMNDLRDHFASIRGLEDLDLGDASPGFRFDPRWEDDHDGAA